MRIRTGRDIGGVRNHVSGDAIRKDTLRNDGNVLINSPHQDD